MTQLKDETKDLVSVIITILNGGQWIDNCMESIIKQTAVQQHGQIKQLYAHNPVMSKMALKNSRPINNIKATSKKHEMAEKSIEVEKEEEENTIDCQTKKPLQIEICVFDDCSCDNTLALLNLWKSKLKEQHNIEMVIVRNETGKSRGVGFGRNRAIEASKGNYLCFQDIDDEMLPQRIEKQLQLAKSYKKAIIGSKFIRIPENSTCRYTKWANELTSDKFLLQIYTANGPTIIMPTWFCHRSVYMQIQGGFAEDGKGCPEDLILFFKHLDNCGEIVRVEECLLKYRYHLESASFSVHSKTIWHIRLKYLIEHKLKILPWCQGFSIWNAGKQGRRFFRDLQEDQKKAVRAFCDVDKNKINKTYKYYDSTLRKCTFSIPIIHFSEVKPPVVICMKLDLTNGAFERNLSSLNFEEDKDYILFT